MRFNTLRSIGHNIADSLGCGMGFLIGVYETKIFEEASAAPTGSIEVDFLTGSTSRPVSASLQRAIQLYAAALPALCERHKVSIDSFSRLVVRYVADGSMFGRFDVLVSDNEGRSAEDSYVDQPGRRVKIVDPLGRVRTERPRVTRTA